MSTQKAARFKMLFGNEQALAEPNLLRRLTFQLMGNPHAGAKIRLRSLIQALDFLAAEHGFTIGDAAVLDAGSGKGEYAFYLASRYPEACIVGIELNPEKVGRATEIARVARFPKVAFHQADLTALSGQDAFDLAICLDVLEHIENDCAALESLYRALRPGGYLILHVPNNIPAHFAIEEPGHVREGYENEELKAKLSRVGFEVLQLRNPIGPCGRWADDICEVLGDYPILRGLGIPLYAVLTWADQFGSLTRQFPHGAGLLGIGRKAWLNKPEPQNGGGAA